MNDIPMIPCPNPQIGETVYIDVMGNGTFNPFTLIKIHPEVSTEDDEEWSPEVWVFEGTGRFFHYPHIDRELKAFKFSAKNS